jgi:hypothetical protein
MLTVSWLQIMFNKAILDFYGFRYPIFLTCWHMVFATTLTQILARTTSMFTAVNNKVVNWEIFFKRVCPVAVVFALSLILSNTAYIYLSVSFIQVNSIAQT